MVGSKFLLKELHIYYTLAIYQFKENKLVHVSNMVRKQNSFRRFPIVRARYKARIMVYAHSSNESLCYEQMLHHGITCWFVLFFLSTNKITFLNLILNMILFSNYYSYYSTIQPNIMLQCYQNFKLSANISYAAAVPAVLS